MEFLRVTGENLDREHICCALTGADAAGKKAWLADRFADGLVFCKGDARGKCFVEYLPGEKAWAPVEAEGLLWINCLWVSGQLAGQGNAGQLLERCEQDALDQGRGGLAILSADKKRPYLADPRFLTHMGFTEADRAGYFRLYWRPLDGAARPPRFRDCARAQRTDCEGLILYYTCQCPFAAKYAPLAERLAAARGVPLRALRLETMEQAQAAPSPFTAYAPLAERLCHPRDYVGEKAGQAPDGAGKGGLTWWNPDADCCAVSAPTARARAAPGAYRSRSPSGARAAR